MAAMPRLFVSSDDLHAFVDEMLPPRAATRVAAALEQDEAVRNRVEAYQRQNAALRRLHTEILDEPLPAAMAEMITAARRHPSGGR